MRRTQVFVLVAILLIGIGCVVYVVRVLRRGFSTRVAPGKIESSLALTMRDMAIPARYKTMKNPVTITPEVVHEGMAHWADHCATCHANNGNGATMYGNGMYPRPPDMRLKHPQEMSDGELYHTIKDGVRMSGMPAFGDPGDNDLDSWKLVAFIRHLPRLSDHEVLEMERLNPKSPEEMQEQMEEDQFLNGGKPPQTPHMHH